MLAAVVFCFQLIMNVVLSIFAFTVLCLGNWIPSLLDHFILETQ